MLNILGVLLICMGTGACYSILGDELQQVRNAAAASTATHTEEEKGLVPATHVAEERVLVMRTEEEQEPATDAGEEQAPPCRAERGAGAES
jgi:hypothetical protein